MASGSSTDETGPPHRIPDSPDGAADPKLPRPQGREVEVDGLPAPVESGFRKPSRGKEPYNCHALR
ncbi:hypothetical protein CN179_27425 [Sinorhizobium medicae]|nr:hypothetical protein CN179_27425 [Sinorhizobium medicae]